MSSSSQRKSNRRNTHSEQFTESHELVEIERNPLEQLLLDTKHWLQKNVSLVRYFSLALLVTLVVILAVVFFHSWQIENHSARLFSLLSRLQIAKSQETKNLLLPESEELCRTWWPTYVSRNSCLLSAAILGQDKKYKEMLPFMESFNSSSSKKDALALTLFYQGIASENSGDLQAALGNFQQLEKYLTKTQNQDIAIFQQARILYRQQKWQKAQEMFSKLLKDYASGDYAAECKKYLVLIAVRQSQNK